MNVSDIQHAARVAVDEEGVVAAAYTLAMVEAQCGTTSDAPEIDFILDRPFLFVITGSDNLPLFAGVVAEP